MHKTEPTHLFGMSSVRDVEDQYVLLDLSLTIVGLSTGKYEFCGYAPGDLLGRHARILFSREVLAQFYDLAQGVDHKGIEYEIIRRDGNRATLWITATVIGTVDEKRILLRTRDVPHVNPPMSTLIVESLLLNDIQDAIVVRDHEDRICFWNRAAECLYGWQACEVLGQNVYDILFPRELQNSGDKARCLAGPGTWAGELQQVTKAGNTINVESCWKVQCDEMGRSVYVFMINRASDKDRLQSALVRAQRIEAVGKLAAAIAHDLNGALSTLLISLRALSPEDMDGRHRDALEASQISAEHAAQLITQLLSLAKDPEAEPTFVDLGAIINTTVRVLRNTFPESIKIEVIVPSDLRHIAGDKTHLHQLLLNLCMNARDAMPSGGRLTITARNLGVNDLPNESRLTITARSLVVNDLPNENFSRRIGTAQRLAGNYVSLTVADTGIGMAPEIRRRLFEPLFTTKRHSGGSGLGLFTVASIVKKYNGLISLSSTRKRGTQFTIYLPANRAYF